MSKAGRPKTRTGEYERITLEVRKDVLQYIDDQPAYRREVFEKAVFAMMNEDLKAQIMPETMCNVDDDDTRSQIVRIIDQYYWNDNGDETDGPAYLIESDELTNKQIAELGLTVTNGTYLKGYDPEAHKEALNGLAVAWTGWTAEHYALIAATPEQVYEALKVE
jgi:hypothetical protein